MNQIKFKGVSMNLIGNVDLKNKQLNIKAIDKEGNIKSFLDFKKGIKVLSTFPKLNTSVCDNQTKAIARLAKKHSDVTFISLTMDSVQTIGKWCLAHNLENITILSDKDRKEFSKATNLLIKKLKMLARGFIILDKENNVIDHFYKLEITDEPMYDQLEKALSNI